MNIMDNVYIFIGHNFLHTMQFLLVKYCEQHDIKAPKYKGCVI